jgi:hypothetical protein
MVPSSSDNSDMLPIFNDFSVTNIYFKALVDSGTTVNIINRLPLYIKGRKNFNNPNLTSVKGHKLDAKGSIPLDAKKDNRIFSTIFIICNNFSYEAIISANFLKANSVLLNVANERLVHLANSSSRRVEEEDATVNRIQYFLSQFSTPRGHCIARNWPSSQSKKVNSHNKWIESAEAKIGDMQQYRSNEIMGIVEVWKKVELTRLTIFYWNLYFLPEEKIMDTGLFFF